MFSGVHVTSGNRYIDLSKLEISLLYSSNNAKSHILSRNL